MSLAEVEEKLDEISEEWRSQTATEQKAALKDLDGLLEQLDTLQTDSPTAAHNADELRGRIEILMDEIDISLGIEPTPISGLADYDLDQTDEETHHR